MKSQKSANVCLIVENLPVPLDRRVWKEARALRDAGYGVSVICPKGPGYSTSYEVLENIEIYRHRAWEASGALGYIAEYSWALAAELFLALKVFARTRFRVLHASNPPDTIFLIAWLLKPLGVRFIFDQHDLGPELFEAKFGKRAVILHRLTRLLEYCSFRTANACIATNDSFKEIAISRGRKSPASVFVVRNCPDLATFRKSAAKKTGKGNKPFLVAYVGFMGSQDGLDLLLRSIDHIVHNQKRQDTHFVLVGGGSVLGELEAIIHDRQLASYVTMTGQVSHEEVATWLSSADLGVAPDPKNAMNDKLTMIKILEYMAFSLPVVLFELEEGKRIAGPAALYAKPNDPVNFAEQITALLDSPELRHRLGGCGRKRIEEGLNWDREKQSLIATYATVLRQERV